MNVIILDIDGTLIDSMGVDPVLYFAAIERVLGKVRLRDLDEYEHVTDSGILAQVLEENPVPDPARAATVIKERFLDGLREHINRSGSFPVIDGAVQFVDRLRRSTDVTLAVATGCWRESALLKLKTSGFDIAGLPVATSDDAVSRVEIMKSALRMARGGSGTVTYFGDALWDQRACAELGWDFVAVGSALGGIATFAEVEL